MTINVTNRLSGGGGVNGGGGGGGGGGVMTTISLLVSELCSWLSAS